MTHKRRSLFEKFIRDQFLGNRQTKMKNIDAPISEKVNIENLYLQTRDNVKIGCYLLSPKQIEQDMIYSILLKGKGRNRKEFCEVYKVPELIENMVCLIPDYRDFGDSEGYFEVDNVVFDIECCLEFMVKKYKTTVHIISFSLGTALALEFIRYVNIPEEYKVFTNIDQSMIGRIILIAGFTNSIKVLEMYKTWKIIKKIYPKAEQIVRNDFMLCSLTNIRYTNDKNVLIIHGMKDEIVPFEHSLFLKNTKNFKYFFTANDNHASILKNKEVWRKIFSFINKYKNK